MTNLLIGIAGGTASGKTSFAKKIMEEFCSSEVVLIDQDSYYCDLEHLTFEERLKNNFDHPNSVDVPLLVAHLKSLKAGESIEKPVYNFVTHTREKNKTEMIVPSKVMIIEGILIFAIKEIRDLIDVKLFVDTDADVRIIRRIVRDINERGRSLEGVIDRYLNQVKLMHDEFVEPSKRWADIIIPEGGHNQTALDFVINRIKTLVTE
jgi:uridine kinase